MIAPPGVSTAEISALLQTAAFGRVLHVHDVAVSTNDLAREMAASGAPEGAAVIAREQTAGRGRHGHRWFSPRGGLWISVIFRPVLPLDAWPLLGFVLALASSTAVDALAGLRTGVKWPNDVMAGPRKLAGVLVESGPGFAVGGVGINANIPGTALHAALGDGVTSVHAVTARTVDLNVLAAELLRRIEQFYADLCTDRTLLLDEWRRRAISLGRMVHVLGATPFEGVAEGVDDSGALLVRTSGGLRVVRAGAVSIRLVGTPGS